MVSEQLRKLYRYKILKDKAMQVYSYTISSEQAKKHSKTNIVNILEHEYQFLKVVVIEKGVKSLRIASYKNSIVAIELSEGFGNISSLRELLITENSQSLDIEDALLILKDACEQLGIDTKEF